MQHKSKVSCPETKHTDLSKGRETWSALYRPLYFTLSKGLTSDNFGNFVILSNIYIFLQRKKK